MGDNCRPTHSEEGAWCNRVKFGSDLCHLWQHSNLVLTKSYIFRQTAAVRFQEFLDFPKVIWRALVFSFRICGKSKKLPQNLGHTHKRLHINFLNATLCPRRIVWDTGYSKCWNRWNSQRHGAHILAGQTVNSIAFIMWKRTVAVRLSQYEEMFKTTKCKNSRQILVSSKLQKVS